MRATTVTTPKSSTRAIRWTIPNGTTRATKNMDTQNRYASQNNHANQTSDASQDPDDTQKKYASQDYASHEIHDTQTKNAS